MTTAFLGIDFSGGAAPWRVQASKPTVWIARIHHLNSLLLDDLRPVQNLAGSDAPFQRLARLLAEGQFRAAAIDAPFCLPDAHMPQSGLDEFLRLVSSFPNGEDRPFPNGATIVELGERYSKKTSPKPVRATERYWISKGVNTRSTMWNGPRGGAPFAAACCKLLALSGRPVWPWATASSGLLVEAFPAAQLRQWQLPFQGYSKPEQRGERELILEALRRRLIIDKRFEDVLLSSPDALDAVIAAFAAIAVASGRFLNPTHSRTDGLIAVHP
jgi:predicted nuclease with RNAse H fold